MMMRLRFFSEFKAKQLLLLLLMVVAMVYMYYMQQWAKTKVPAQRLLSAISNIYSVDTDVYDVEEVSRWYKGSACSTRREEFVGDMPLFPPCSSDITAGVATWGRYPYVGPFNYVKASKTPCWYSEGQLLCIPYYYLIGVSKSGTNDLYHFIVQHPEAVGASKEMHWFDRYRYEGNQYHRDPRGLINFTAGYSRAASLIQDDMNVRGLSTRIIGDASPSYFYDNNEWPQYSGNENCTEPRVLLAHHIRHLFPDVKIILIIRHPVNRLYARYIYDYRNVRLKNPSVLTPQYFHDIVVDGLSKYRACFDQWSLRHCVYNRSLWESVHKLRIQESIYPVMLEDWLRVIPRKQMLLVRFEDYAKNRSKELSRVYQFLEMRPLNQTEMQRTEQARIANKAKYKPGPMLPETEKLLHAFYQPFVRRLAAMLGDRRFLWPEVQSSA